MKYLAFVFYSMMSDSLKFVENHSRAYNIDKSHNHHHSLEVLYWSLDIMKHTKYRYTPNDLKVIFESCILHDMVDKKYNLGTEHVESYLNNKHEKDVSDAIMNIINTISYSKTFINNKLVFPDWITDNEYKEAYHIVRESDLLSSYNIARMIEYRLAQDMPVSYIKKEIVEFYNERMANLIRRKFFVHHHATKRAQQLNEIGKLKLEFIDHYEIENNNLDFFRFVDFIDLEKIALSYHSLCNH